MRALPSTRVIVSIVAGNCETKVTEPLMKPNSCRGALDGEICTAMPGWMFLPSDEGDVDQRFEAGRLLVHLQAGDRAALPDDVALHEFDLENASRRRALHVRHQLELRFGQLQPASGVVDHQLTARDLPIVIAAHRELADRELLQIALRPLELILRREELRTGLQNVCRVTSPRSEQRFRRLAT